MVRLDWKKMGKEGPIIKLTESQQKELSKCYDNFYNSTYGWDYMLTSLLIFNEYIDDLAKEHVELSNQLKEILENGQEED